MSWSVAAVDPGDQAGVALLGTGGELAIYAVRARGKDAATKRLRTARWACLTLGGSVGVPYDLLAIEYAPRAGVAYARTNGWLGVAAGLWHAIRADRCVYVNATWKRDRGLEGALSVLERQYRIEWPSPNARDALGVLLRAQRDLRPDRRVAIRRVVQCEEVVCS